MKNDKKLNEMSDAEFKAYLKKNKMTGMAALITSRTRRAVIKAMGVNPNKPQPISSHTPSKDDPVLGYAVKLDGYKSAEVFRDPTTLSGKMTMPEGYRSTEIIPPPRKDQGSDQDRALAQASKTIDLTPTFSSVMSLYRAVILDASRKGREELIPDIRKMAAMADLCNNGSRIIAATLKQLKQGGTVANEIEAMEIHMKAFEQLKSQFP